MTDDPATARRESTSYELHGDRIEDPYRWFEDEDERDRLDEWIDAQSARTNEYLESVDVRERLEPEFEELVRTTDYGSIVARPAGYFQSIETPEHEQPVLTFRRSLGDERSTVLDPNEWSDDATVAMGWWSVSPEGNRLAYGVDEGGDELYDVTVVEIDAEARETGAVIAELPNLGRAGPPAWTSDGVYYYRTGTEGESQLRKSIHFHAFGTDPEEDPTLMEIDEPSAWPNLVTDRAGEHLLVELVTSWDRTDLYYAPVGTDDLTPVLTGTEHLFSPLVDGDTAYLRTNHDAPYYRVLELDLGGDVEPTSPESLAEVVPERAGILAGATIADDRLFLQYERDAVSSIEVLDPAAVSVGTETGEDAERGEEAEARTPLDADGFDEYTRELSLPDSDLATVTGLSGNRDEPEAFFAYQSFDRPQTVVRYDLRSDGIDELDRPDVSHDVDLSVEQVRFESADGTDVPAFVIHRADLALDGTHPALLYGYGGFENSLTPSFARFVGPFLRSCGVYAVANLRGGAEYGKEWHEAARHEGKQRTFDDMIAAAEHLIEEGYADEDRIAIQGGSNGGLTVGAVMTQRPDLPRAVLCHVPLLDMLRYHTFLLGASWTTEYGSPEDESAYEWIREYSPYHNLEERAYPAVLFKTAESDTRVHPVHAWKMAARMQHLDTGDLVTLCKTARDTGHGTGKPTWMVVEEALDTWSFVFEELDVSYVDESSPS